MFYNIVQQTGKAESEDLFQVAELAFKTRNMADSVDKGDNLEDIQEENGVIFIESSDEPGIPNDKIKSPENKPVNRSSKELKDEEMKMSNSVVLGSENRTVKQISSDTENLSNSVSEKTALLENSSDQKNLTDKTRTNSSAISKDDPSSTLSVTTPLLEETASDNSVHV